MTMPTYHYIELLFFIALLWSTYYARKTTTSLEMAALLHIAKKYPKQYKELSLPVATSGRVIGSRIYRSPEKLPHDARLDAFYKNYKKWNILFAVSGILIILLVFSRLFINF